MTRIDLIELLQTLFPDIPILNVGQHYKRSTEPFIVVRKATQLPELYGSRLGAYQIFDIMIYTPHTSITLLEQLVDDVYLKLKSSEPYKRKVFQFTGNVNMDYHDIEIEMYMNYITIQVPREWGAPDGN